MKKSDRIGVVLRKFDYEWSKKGKTFCQVVKEFIGEKNIVFKQDELSDDDILENIKDIHPDEKYVEK